jgi:hypothetical protein
MNNLVVVGENSNNNKYVIEKEVPFPQALKLLSGLRAPKEATTSSRRR